MQDNTHEDASLIHRLGWVLICLGWFYSLAVANGGELPKLALVAVLSVPGAICCLIGSSKKFPLLFLSLFSVFAGYLVFRAAYSDVFDLGRRDIFLVGNGVLFLLAGYLSLTYTSNQKLFFNILRVALVLSLGACFYQYFIEPDFALFRSERSNVKGVSGLFYHRNYFAGFLALMMPVWVLKWMRNPARNWVDFGFALVTILLGFFTNSRSGFLSLIVGAATAIFFYKKYSLGSEEGSSRKWVLWLSAGVALVLLLVSAFVLLPQILDNRGGAEAGLKNRMKLAGIAYDAWLQRPWIGNGAHSFSYLFPKMFLGLGGWVGDAKMVHSDFLQVLCDYGLVGLILLLLSILLLFGKFFSMGKSSHLLFAGVAVGILVSEIVRAIVDFNLHLAPNLFLFAMLIGGGLCEVMPAQTSPKASWRIRISTLYSAVVCLAFSVLLLSIGGKEIKASRSFLEVEKIRLEGDHSSDDYEKALRAYCDSAPSFEKLRDLASISLAKAIRGEESFGVAESDWGKVVARHPLDGESLANYARCLDENGKLHESDEFHGRALTAVGRRENKYGVIFGVGLHFVRQGDHLYQQRKPGEALFLYQQALEAFEESYQKNYSRRVLNRPMIERVRKNIAFLKKARIEPVTVNGLNWRDALN